MRKVYRSRRETLVTLLLENRFERSTIETPISNGVSLKRANFSRRVGGYIRSPCPVQRTS